MCLPLTLPLALTLASTALTGAQAGLGFMAQNQQAEAQMSYAKANAESANQAYLHQVTGAQTRFNQESAKTQQELHDRQILAEQAKARVRVSAGEAGVTGVSVANLLAEYDRVNAQAKTAADYNTNIRRLEFTESLTGARADAINRQRSVGPIEKPSWLMPILQTGSAFASSYLNNMTFTTPAGQMKSIPWFKPKMPAMASGGVSA